MRVAWVHLLTRKALLLSREVSLARLLVLVLGLGLGLGLARVLAQKRLLARK